MGPKIVREPKVCLVGSQRVHWCQDDDSLGDIEGFLDDHDASDWRTDAPGDPEFLVEIAGRLCYMSFRNPRPGGNAAYIKHLLEVQHGSVLEHAVYSFIFTGISRSLSHELVRHRAGWSYSQLSQRYVDESDCEFVEPEVIANDPFLHMKFVQQVATAKQMYERLSRSLGEKFRDDPKDQAGRTPTERRKAAREAARPVLPNCTETKIFATVNARALRHFIELRASLAAEPEIRRLALAVLKVVQGVSPNIFGDYEIKTEDDGRQWAWTPYRKV